jgi:hypothetical protein
MSSRFDMAGGKVMGSPRSRSIFASTVAESGDMDIGYTQRKMTTGRLVSTRDALHGLKGKGV